MTAQIKMSHPSDRLRGKIGDVYEIKYKTRYLYQYSAPPDKDGTTSNGIVYVPMESFKIYDERQHQLIERGMIEHVKEIPTNEIDYVELNVETVNTTTRSGMTTLMGVSPMSYQRVLVDGKDVTFFSDDGREL